MAWDRKNFIVYGANCVWWDSIDKIGRTPPINGRSLPCCPHCGSVLYEMPPEQWWAGVDRFEREKKPGYRKFIEWQRGKCFRKSDEAWAAFEAAHPAPGERTK